MRWRATILMLTIALPSQGQVYRCERNGETVFSQQPCGEDAAEVDLHLSRPSAEAVRETQQRAARDQASAAQWRARQEADQRIRAAEARLHRAEHERDQELAEIAQRRAEAYENFDGSMLEEAEERALEADRQAVLDHYEPAIRDLRSEIEQLRSEPSQ